MTDEDKGFTVKDKRRLSTEGDVADPTGGMETGSGAARAGCGDGPPLPEVTFATFIFSLGTSALVCLGELPDPNSNQLCPNLPLAKQTIDILGMLEQKTKGNLDGQEENLLGTLLYELRLKYVSALRG